MNDSIKRISLDIHSTGSGETVNAKRGDTARKIIVSLVDGGVPYSISEDCYAVFTAKKPDKNVVYNACTIENNTIIYDVTEQTVATEGRVECEIKLYGADDKLITSPKFTINVFGTVYNEGDEIESSDEFSALTKLVSDSLEAIDAAENATADANEAAENANAATSNFARSVKNALVIGEVHGTNISLDDAAELGFPGFRIFGKTTQGGVPTPDAPVDLVSVGDSGSITVNVTGDNDAHSMTIATPNGLPGIPVATGGNYTDANGQQWICDEIDFARGVYVQRVKQRVLNGTESWSKNMETANNYLYFLKSADVGDSYVMCDSLPKKPTSLLSMDGVSADLMGIAANKEHQVIYLNIGMLMTENKPSGLKNILAQRNITVNYPIAIPIETTLSEEELATYAALHTYRGNTAVSNDAEAWMNLEYVMDAKKYIDEMIAGTMYPAKVE